MKEFAIKYPAHGVKTTCEQYGVILQDAKALRCPVDGEELFSLEQVEAIRWRVAALGPRLKLIRKITRAAGRESRSTCHAHNLF